MVPLLIACNYSFWRSRARDHLTKRPTKLLFSVSLQTCMYVRPLAFLLLSRSSLRSLYTISCFFVLYYIFFCILYCNSINIRIFYVVFICNSPGILATLRWIPLILYRVCGCAYTVYMSNIKAQTMPQRAKEA